MKYNWKIIGISFCIIISMFIIIQLIANLTGIASGRIEITTIKYVIMITFVVIYIISLIILGISSILLVKKYSSFNLPIFFINKIKLKFK